MAHNPPPPTPSGFQSIEEHEKYIYPDSTLDKAFIISKIRSLLGDYATQNEDKEDKSMAEPNGHPSTSPPTPSSLAPQSLMSPPPPPVVSPKPSALPSPARPLATTPPPHTPTTPQATTPPHTLTPRTNAQAQTPTPTHANASTPVISSTPPAHLRAPSFLTPLSDGTPRGSEADESTDNTDEQNESMSYGPEKEKIETCCMLWDISSSPEHSKFLHENHIIPVLYSVISNAQSARLVEVAIGILGNIASVPSIAEDITNHEISTLITSQLFLTLDPPVLNETCRTIASCIYTETCKDKWVEAISNNNCQVLGQILDILQNTLDQELLERVLMLVAILIYVDALRREMMSRQIGPIVSQVLVEQMTGDNMPNEAVLELFMRILEGLCVVLEDNKENPPLTDLDDSFIRCLARIVARNDSEDIVATAVVILYSIVVHETAVTVLATDEEFSRALIDLLSSESSLEWSLLLAMIEISDSNILAVVDECVESILNLSPDGKDFNFAHEAIAKVNVALEKTGKYRSSVHKISAWLKRQAT